MIQFMENSKMVSGGADCSSELLDTPHDPDYPIVDIKKALKRCLKKPENWSGS